MRLGTRLSVTLAALALLLSAAQRTTAGCLIERLDRDGNGTDDLRLAGSSGRQNVLVELRNDGTNLVQVDCNNNGSLLDAGDATFSDAGTIESYYFELLGNDTITINVTQDLSGASKSLIFYLPGLDNTIYFNTLGNDLVANTILGLDFVGLAGAERITLDFSGSAVSNSFVYVRGDLGGGPDRLHVVGPATATDSILDVVADAGLGNNFATYDDGGGSLSGSLVSMSFAGADSRQSLDTVATALSGQVENGSRFSLHANLLRGNDIFSGGFALDTFAVDPSGAAGSEVAFHVKGGEDFDTLVASGSGTAPAVNNGLVEIILDGHNQPDTVSMDWDGVTGAGVLRLRSYTGEGRDTILTSILTDATSNNDLDILVQAGMEGDLSQKGDLVYLSVLDPGAATYGPSGAVILDGGVEGVDSCIFFGDVPFLRLQCES